MMTKMAETTMTWTVSPVMQTASTPPEKAQEMLDDLPVWDLNDLYQGLDAPELQADLAAISERAKAFEAAHKGKLAGYLEKTASTGASSGESQLTSAIKAYEELEDLLGRLYSYAGLIYASDTSKPEFAKFYGDIQEKITNASAHLLFFTLELNRIEDAALDRALQDASELAHYQPWLNDIRAERPYQLDDKIEQLFHEKNVSGRAAWNRMFDDTISSLRCTVSGETLTLEETLNKLLEHDETVRKDASDAMASAFRAEIGTFTLITNTLAKDKEISDRWRGFEDVADSRHLSNRVEREVVDALVSAVCESYPKLSHRYYALKAKWMGKERLPHWDRNAPLPNQPKKLYQWQEARDIVLSAYGDFAPKMATIAGDFFDKRWIDAPTRPGKAPGAFAHPTVPSAHPYVLLNYQGRARDVMTLAHELGHGVHQVLAGAKGPLMAPTPLTLAETASVFGEMLTFKSLLASAASPQERQAMIAGKVEDMINTVVRQIAFYQFERLVHEERRNGELTADQLCDFWMSVQGDSLGPSIELMPGYETFWVYIPHFIRTPFYVYAYAFGDCLVNSLYAVYEDAEAGFQDRYFDMLSAGGTMHHSQLLAPFGLNAADPSFWHKGLSVIENLISELEAADDV